MPIRLDQIHQVSADPSDPLGVDNGGKATNISGVQPILDPNSGSDKPTIVLNPDPLPGSGNLKENRESDPNDSRSDESRGIELSENPLNDGIKNLGLTAIEKSLFASEVAERIREVYDPEIPVNVYDLGLIYDIQVDDKRNVHLVMTLTSPACPVAGSLPGEVEMAARRTPNIGRVTLELTWDPPFTIEMIPFEIRVALGLD